MMLADFDTFKLDEKDYFQGFIFLLFVVLITIVLFNLLNALAISDTIKILQEAELVDTKKRISILNTYEKLFRIVGKRLANILPEMSRITITPNVSNVIKVKIIEPEVSKISKLKQKFLGNSMLVEVLRKRDQKIKMEEKTLRAILDFVSTQQEQNLV